MTLRLSARQQVVLSLIEQAAANDRCCPTNDALADAMNASAGSYAGVVVGELEDLGVILVERFAKGRVVEVVETGARTAPIRRKALPTKRPEPRQRRATGDGDDELFRGVPPIDRIVERDPCWRCETRADVGCRHRPASGTRPVEHAPDPPDRRGAERDQPYGFMTRKRR